jgi:hypothetical protein
MDGSSLFAIVTTLWRSKEVFWWTQSELDYLEKEDKYSSIKLYIFANHD